MSPRSHGELIALVNCVKSDAIALLEALYHSHPELRSSDEVELGRWNQADIKVIDDNGMSHDHLGRFDGGSGGFGFGLQRYHFPLEGVLPGVSRSKLDTRDETTKKLFNGLFSVSGQDSPAVLERSEKLFAREMQTDDWKQLSGAPDGHDVKIKASGSSIEIRIEKGKFFDKFVISNVHPGDGEITQQSSYLELDAIFTNKNAPERLAPRMLSSIFDKCDELGIDTVSLEAAGYRGHNKGYTGYSRWPQLGFDADLSEVEKATLPAQYKGSETIGDILERGGFNWWVEHGTGRRMDFDLSPGSRSRKVFETYLSSRNIKTG